MDIDFVVLWVDGNDPVWQAEKAKYQGRTLDDSNSGSAFHTASKVLFRYAAGACRFLKPVK